MLRSSVMRPRPMASRRVSTSITLRSLASDIRCVFDAVSAGPSFSEALDFFEGEELFNDAFDRSWRHAE